MHHQQVNISPNTKYDKQSPTQLIIAFRLDIAYLI